MSDGKVSSTVLQFLLRSAQQDAGVTIDRAVALSHSLLFALMR